MDIRDVYRYAWFADLAYVRWSEADRVAPNPADTSSAALIAAANAAERIPGETSQGDLAVDTLGERIFRPVTDGQPGGLRGLGWKLLAFHANADTDSGFAGSVYGNAATGEKVLALRGTEPSFVTPALDDLLNSDLRDIVGFGVAVEQAVALVNWVNRLRAPAGADVAQLALPPDAALAALRAQPLAALAGTGLEALVAGLGRTVTPGAGLGVLAPGERVVVTGHSLGGHLALVAARLFPELVDSAVTFNAPGFDTPLGHGVSESFFAGLARTGVVPEALSSFAGLPVLNVRGESSGPDAFSGGDLDLISRLGTLPGPVQEVLVEVSTHSMDELVTTLGVHALLGGLMERGGQPVSFAQTDALLRAVSPGEARTAEAMVEALDRLLLPATAQPLETSVSQGLMSVFNPPTPYAARSALHGRLVALEAAVARESGLRLESLVGKAPAELEALAAGDVAYRYALVQGNPFVVLGLDYTQHNANHALDRYDPATGLGLTDAYLADRAQYLALKARLFAKDTTVEERSALGDARFTDLATGTVLETSGLSAAQTAESRRVRYVFGTRGADGWDGALDGGAQADRIHAGAGTDLARGGAGDDHIEGGAGDDHLYGDAGADTLLGQAGADRLFGGADADLLEGGPGDDVLVGGVLDDSGTAPDDGAADRLAGGAGFDRYYAGSGDVISDDDGLGRVRFRGEWLGPGAAVPGQADTYRFGSLTYRLAGAVLTVQAPDGAAFTIEGFHDGALGIELAPTARLDTLSGTSGSDTLGLASSASPPGLRVTIAAGGALADGAALADGDTLAQPPRRVVLGGGGDSLQSDPDLPGLVVWGDTAGATPGADGADFIDLDRAGVADGTPVAAPGDGAELHGEGGDDFLGATRRADRLHGDGGHDFLEARAGRDVLYGGDGNDWAEGGAGADLVYGNAGADYLLGGAGGDALIGGPGDDRLYGDAGGAAYYRLADGTRFWDGAAIRPAPGVASVIEEASEADAGADVLDGGDGADHLFAGPGNDTVDGGAGDDHGYGGAGDDVLLGRGGNDILFGDRDPAVVARDGAPVFTGGPVFLTHAPGSEAAGNDVLAGGAGDDLLLGGAGDDTYRYGPDDGTDIVADASGYDTLRLTGIAPQQVRIAPLTALGGPAVVHDLETGVSYRYTQGVLLTMPPGTAADGGRINNRVVLARDGGATGIERVRFDDGTVWTSATLDEALAAARALSPDPQQPLPALLAGDAGGTVTGTAESEALIGGPGDDILTGGGGFDALAGGPGDDLLAGGPLDDRLDGGPGDDTYRLGPGWRDDLVIDAGGSDRIELPAGVTPDEVETGRERDDLVIALADRSASVTVSGWFAGLQARVEALAFADGTVWDAARIEAGTRVLTGSAIDDDITGSAADETLSGLAGDDVLRGGAGDDTLAGGPGADVLDGGPGADTLDGGDGADVYVVAHAAGEDLVADSGADGAPETVRLAPGLTRADLVAERLGDDLRVSATGGGAVRVQGWFTEPQRWHLELASGRRIDLDALFAPPDGDARFLAQAVDGFEQSRYAALVAEADERTRATFDGGHFGQYHAGGVVATITGLRSLVLADVEVRDTAGTDGPDELAGAGGVSYETRRQHGIFIDLDSGGNTGTLRGTFDIVGLRMRGRRTATSGFERGGIEIEAPVTRQTHVLERVALGAGNDVWQGRGAVAVVDGGPGDDRLAGAHAPEGELLLGGPGNDVLDAGSGRDVLAGGPGSDVLRAGDGETHYWIGGEEPGVDYVEDTGLFAGGDVVGFALEAGLPPGAPPPGDFPDLFDPLSRIHAYLRQATPADGEALLDWFAANGMERSLFPAERDVVHVNRPQSAVVSDWRWRAGRPVLALDWGTPGQPAGVELAVRLRGRDPLGFGIEDVAFADGTVPVAALAASLPGLVAGSEGDDSLDGTEGGAEVLLGGEGDDVLRGGGGDILRGGAGDDELSLEAGDRAEGGAGGDTYYVAGPGGRVVIDESRFSDPLEPAPPDGADTLVLSRADGGAFTAGDLTVARAGQDLSITLGATTIDVAHWFDGPQYRIERIVLAVYEEDEWAELTGAELEALINRPPVVAAPIGAVTATEDAPFRFAVPAGTFADPDPGDVLALAAGAADGGALPGWLAFDPATGTFSGTPANGDVGALALGVTATDPAGHAVTDTFTLTVENVNDAPLVAAPPAPQQAMAGQAFRYRLPAGTFVDVDAGDTLTLSAALADGGALPGWLSFDAATGTFSGTPALADYGPLALTVTATDRAGASAGAPLVVDVGAEHVLAGSAGADALQGTALAEVLDGGAGDDVLRGGAGADLLEGGDGADRLFGETGDDLLRGGAGADLLRGGAGADLLEGGDGADRLLGDGGDDRLVGGAGHDRLLDVAGSNVLDGGPGDDLIRAGGAGNLVDAGEGADDVTSTGRGDRVLLGPGDDRAVLTGAGASADGGPGADRLLAFRGGELAGGAGPDRLTLLGAGSLDGGPGDDLLAAFFGDHAFDAGAGDDRLYAVAGNDRYRFGPGDGHDRVHDLAGQDTLTLEGVAPSAVWLTRRGSDLDIALAGSGDTLTVQRWFASPANRVERIELDDGRHLGVAEVQRLVQAMAAFAPPAGAGLAPPPEVPEALAPVLAAAWQPVA